MTKEQPVDAAPKWKTVEKVVRLLEATIDPDASVRHNVNLPDYSMAGEPTQCDVVIEAGQDARRTRTIVEVQDRGRPLGVPDLRSFYEKMLGVRAQHLICVSTIGFSKPAIEYARGKGPAIRLVKLKELEQSKWPVNFAFGRFSLIEQDAQPVGCRLKGSKFDNFALDRSPREVTFNMQDRVFEYRKHGGVSRVLKIADVFQAAVDETPYYNHQKEPVRVSMKRRFDVKDRLWIKVGKRKFCVGEVEFDMEIRTRLKFIPVRMMDYTQEEHDGVLGWSAIAEGVVDGRAVQIRASFRSGSDDRLYMHSYEIEGVRGAGPMVFEELDTDDKLQTFERLIKEHDDAEQDAEN